ncbi:MAG: 2,3-bisphosphoglycerate-independent phosphoglycerate mutase [Gammaproteobacteria bacterium]|nr:2,3-bisphosphoglycerate-independent phosphoglycerate mutase [Gammaproteobacteria bacterium]
MSEKPNPLLLVVLDGWGYSESTRGNAVHSARKPVWDSLWKNYPHTLIRTSGTDVGLPADQMGNSEVGHLNLGAGRVVYQEFSRISRAIKTGAFYDNPTLTGAVDKALAHGKAVHILGLLSPGGVHSHEDHILAMAELAVKRGAKKVYAHAFLDGRDTAPKSAHSSLKALQDKFDTLGSGRIASLIGRYYAMDRDHRWPRIQQAYDLVTQGKAEFEAPDALSALDLAYARGESDEFVKATAIVPRGDVQGRTSVAEGRMPGATEKPVRMEDGDVVVFMNFRSDRARQITRPFIEPDFDGFQREVKPRLGAFVSLTEYSDDFDIPVAFPAERLNNVFGAYVAQRGLHQLRIAETEKYAHVTFFFNGGEEQPFVGEDRILVPSPLVATYDLQPEMSAPEVTGRLVQAIESGKYDVIICNFANPDMVGHTGNFDAAVKAIEAIDAALGKIHQALQRTGGEMLITADHGNAEQMIGEGTGQAHTAHTTNPVPFIYVGRPALIAKGGVLSDVAPTLLYLMGLPIPAEMTGRPLVTLVEEGRAYAG